METYAAVLTGDLVASTNAGSPAVEKAMSELVSASREIQTWPLANIKFTRLTRFTRHRGDGWQVFLDFPGNALRACLFYTARLRASDCGLTTRISVGLGKIDSLGTNDLSDARGDAFTISGHGLDEMPRSSRLTIFGNRQMEPWHTAIYDLADWQSRRWSREQAEAIALALDPSTPTQEEMAKTLRITRQALQARLSSAGFHALTAALSAFENPIEDTP